ncbi:MAG: hypothetical protein NZ519_07515 [Bacteroidia bacterium]|nr:hypothetical protein [Bacteroidia bacterium]MDW8301653.1 hypothetical protein [Bacteroidia bacterium]
MRRVGVSPVRSEAKHRSDSVARSTPTLPIQAQRSMGKGTPKKLKIHTLAFT